jgi:hypothetical protein
MIKVILGYQPGSWVPAYGQTEVWSTVHTGTAIICACLPIFMPLVKRISSTRLLVWLRMPLANRVKSISWPIISKSRAQNLPSRKKRSSISALYDLETILEHRIETQPTISQEHLITGEVWLAQKCKPGQLKAY